MKTKVVVTETITVDKLDLVRQKREVLRRRHAVEMHKLNRLIARLEETQAEALIAEVDEVLSA